MSQHIRKKAGQEVLTYPRDQLSLEPNDVVEHMRGTALSYMVEKGADDMVGEWLWRLANSLESDLAKKRSEAA